jgi:hypothetical protein
LAQVRRNGNASKLLVSSLLVLLPLLSSGYGVSQTVTTFTSVGTTTSSFTNTVTSSFPVQTSYLTSTQQQTILAETFTIDAPSPNHCYYYAYHFTGAKGDHITGQMSSTVPVNVYMMTEKSYDTWEAEGRCQVTVSTIINTVVSNPKAIDKILPADGTYYFVFVLYEAVAPADVQFYILGPSTTFTLTSTAYSATMQTFVAAATLTATNIYTTEVPQSALGSIDPMLLGAIAVVVVIIIVGFILYRSRSRKPTPDKPMATTQAARTCPKCGATPLAGSKFCYNCGAATGD